MSMMQTDTPENRSSYKQIAVSETVGGGSLVMRSFGDVVAFAELMARSQHAIPSHLRNNPGACMAITLQAMRWQMDPFAVASKSYSVKEGATIAYEAQLFAAVVHTRAPIKRAPDYTFSGEGQRRRCTVSAEMKDGSTKVYTSPEIGTIKVKNSPLWLADPDHQLGYYSIRAWARRYTPEVILGVYSPDELENGILAARDRPQGTPPAAAPLRGLQSKLDAIADAPARDDKVFTQASEEDGNGEVIDHEDASPEPANDDQAHDEAETIADQQDAGNVERKPDPAKDAVVARLRDGAAKGTKVLRNRISTLSEQDAERLDSDDHEALFAMAAEADRAAGRS